MTARALLVDCDGVLAEMEDGGHLRAFNQVWVEEGIPWRWSPQDYLAATVRTCGGHERLLELSDSPDFRRAFGPIPGDVEWHALTLGWHRRKSELLAEEIRDRGVSARPGIRRLASEAVAAGWRVAVVSSGARSTVRLITDRVFGTALAAQVVVVAGEDVSAKKPDPQCYRIALALCDSAPEAAIAVEDSASGLAAATGARIPCLVTATSASREEPFADALAVVDCLGDPPRHPARSLRADSWQPDRGMVHLHDLERLRARRTPQTVGR